MKKAVLIHIIKSFVIKQNNLLKDMNLDYSSDESSTERSVETIQNKPVPLSVQLDNKAAPS